MLAEIACRVDSIDDVPPSRSQFDADEVRVNHFITGIIQFAMTKGQKTTIFSVSSKQLLSYRIGPFGPEERVMVS